MQLQIKINTPANADEIAIVETGLEKFNNESSTIKDVKSLHLIATGKEGKVYGGVIARTWGKCCELEQFWVDAEYRGKGAGTLLLDSFEKEAVNRGCNLIYLSTFSFQAPQFYEKRGYTEVFRFRGFSGGEEKIYMQKNIGL